MNQEKTSFAEGVNNKSNDPILDELEDIENIIQKCPQCYDRLKMLALISATSVIAKKKLWIVKGWLV